MQVESRAIVHPVDVMLYWIFRKSAEVCGAHNSCEPPLRFKTLVLGQQSNR